MDARDDRQQKMVKEGLEDLRDEIDNSGVDPIDLIAAAVRRMNENGMRVSNETMDEIVEALL